jgi:hypothetical protein
VKVGNIRSGGQLDPDGILGALVGIIETETFADLAGLDPDGGVVAGVVTGGTAENLDAYGPLFENAGIAGEGMLDNVAQEILAALARAKLVAAQYTIQFFADALRD